MKLVLQNSLTEMRDQGIGLENRWKGILQEISSSISFIPNDNELRRSTWVKGTKIGAIHITGMYKNNIPAVIKLQGIKPITSEVTMIELFNQHNKSKLIRSPKIYEHLPWDQEKQVEVILSEKVEGQWAVAHNPATNEDLERFFSIYEDYRQNCIHTPWVQKPTSFSYSKQL
ncbi:MAG TPA: hypothetical protein VK338_03745, partial [Candidatus Nitrosocosmicus sp.]|nr:hypothetical protein [Candidatus Nitrosocosmicus sp.]